MYKLIKEDGFHNSAVNDNQFHTLSGVSASLYAYAGPDPAGPNEDEKNASIDAGNKDDGLSGSDNNRPLTPGEVFKTPDQVQHEVTQGDLDSNPELVKEGIAVGDEIAFTSVEDFTDPNDENFEDHVLTKKDIDDNPLLKEEGKKPGDIVKYPKTNVA